MQVKHLKSAISSLNQKQKKILAPNLLNKKNNNKVFSNKILKQWEKSPNPILRRMSSYFNYKSNSRKKIYSSDLKEITDSLIKQGYVACSKHDLQEKIKKAGYSAYQSEKNQQKLTEHQDKAQKLARRNELFQRIGIAQNSKQADSQSTNQQTDTPIKPSLVSSFWQTAKKQVLNDKKQISVDLAKNKPITTIANVNLKTPPKIPLVV